MARRERHQLLAAPHQKRVRRNKERVGPLLRDLREGRVNIGHAIGVHDQDLHPDCASQGFQLSLLSRSPGAGWIHQQGDHAGVGNELAQYLQSLGTEWIGRKSDSGDVAAGSIHA